MIYEHVIHLFGHFQIGDQKGDKSLKAFKYNESKALTWLAIKCEHLMATLKEKNFHIGAKSVNYVKSEKFDDPKQNSKIIF